MTTSEELHNAAMDLSIEERLALANRLFESTYDDEKEQGSDEAWDEEVKRRLEEIDSGADFPRIGAPNRRGTTGTGARVPLLRRVSCATSGAPRSRGRTR